ncbi:DUF4365 domain-containing protein [Pseudomonas sp. Q1-7]|uniref:DUF4365 domain-containing protein n=1 Tax=Pseudomonas sp. Q1-7 TaxID=3020843 RepID=UPI002300A58B|nr:DUF4365 domain-containing protein [Pseudomonas sp. Q1-7]
MKQRLSNAKQGRAGVIAVEQACNRLDLIWRNLLEEDVGVDGTIEIAIGNFPTGKIVGAQIKSGMSYIRSETNDSFKFYPDKDDIEYWRALSIPLFLLVHHPANDNIYWVDIGRYVESRGEEPLGKPYISFSKVNTLDRTFESYLHKRFDLAVYTDDQYATLLHELKTLVHVDGVGSAAVTVTALDLFIEGLWGLCSKVQFHSSLMTDLIRKMLREREGEIPITYTFTRTDLYPFFTRYFNILTKNHLALLDVADINESLYVKLEFPTFISSLTSNGRRFVEYLRNSSLPRVHDNQFMSLSVIPHVQIEVYSSFALVDEKAELGPFTDVLAIGFNPYLDYYRLSHWFRAAPGDAAVEVGAQNIHYHALREYLENHFGSVHKDNFIFRYLDIPLSPLICWLEQWSESTYGMPTYRLAGKSAKETVGFSDELMSIMGPVGTITITESPSQQFPLPVLANGEFLIESLPESVRNEIANRMSHI